MHLLEQLDAQDRHDGTPRLKRLRQIPPETGKFLALLAVNIPDGEMIEIGTSGGYSTLWLSLAAKELGRKIVTFEILEEKIQLAKETFHTAQVESIVTLIEGDAIEHLKSYENIAFCFLDAEKEVYQTYFDAVISNMVQGGYLVADNAISHKENLDTMIENALTDSRIDAMVASIGKGLLICRKL